MQGRLSWLHFNLTGGSFLNVSVSTGISAHMQTHTTLATKECRTLLQWAGGGRQLGEEGFSCHSSLEISLERRGNYTKPTMLVLNGCQPVASVSAGTSLTILQPPPWPLLLPSAVKGMRHHPGCAQNPKPCSEKALTGLVRVQ